MKMELFILASTLTLAAVGCNRANETDTSSSYNYSAAPSTTTGTVSRSASDNMINEAAGAARLPGAETNRVLRTNALETAPGNTGGNSPGANTAPPVPENK